MTKYEDDDEDLLAKIKRDRDRKVMNDHLDILIEERIDAGDDYRSNTRSDTNRR